MSFKVMMVFGTRPEAMKMAPLARVLRQWPDIQLNICSTGQRREMLTQVLDAFELTVDEDLQVMLAGTDKSRIVKEASHLLDDEDTYTRMSRVNFPYGDGHASELFATRLHAWPSARSAAGSDV